MRTYIISILVGLSSQALCQTNWKSMGFSRDAIFGIDLAEAEALLINSSPDTIRVAVLDDGVSIGHKSLRTAIWINYQERGHDEDQNGFINDHFGWNFLGSGSGQDLTSSSYEYQRLFYLRRKASKNLPKLDDNQWALISKLVASDSLDRIYLLNRTYSLIKHADSVVRFKTGKGIYTMEDLENPRLFGDANSDANRVKSYLESHSEWTNQRLLQFIETHLDSLKSLPIRDPFAQRRQVVGDNPFSLKDCHYGNPNVNVNSLHGTHVAGIIAGNSVDSLGVSGICRTVKIIPVRMAPARGDEFDKDVALAIRYAVDNGSKVINMSFAKRFSSNPKWVRRAIRYAERKDVIIVLAAGNDAANTDSIPFFPAVFHHKRKGSRKNMIVVGASGQRQENLIAAFSNYGRHSVDLFAPGVDIYSTIPNDQYGTFSGTSMAAPVVTGVVSLLRAYFPELTAKEVKAIIMKSVCPIDFPVTKPGGSVAKNSMTDLCRSGGIINARNAVRLALSLKQPKRIKK